MNCDLEGQDFKIIAVSNRKLCEKPFTEQIERVCQIKPEAIILREKDLSEQVERLSAELDLSNDNYRKLNEEKETISKKLEDSAKLM